MSTINRRKDMDNTQSLFENIKMRNKSISVLNGFESLPKFKESPSLDFSRNSPYGSPESNSFNPVLNSAIQSKHLIRKPPTVWDKIQNKIHLQQVADDQKRLEIMRKRKLDTAAFLKN